MMKYIKKACNSFFWILDKLSRKRFPQEKFTPAKALKRAGFVAFFGAVLYNGNKKQGSGGRQK